jgi:hypothetical protein
MAEEREKSEEKLRRQSRQRRMYMQGSVADVERLAAATFGRGLRSIPVAPCGVVGFWAHGRFEKQQLQTRCCDDAYRNTNPLCLTRLKYANGPPQ